MTEDSETNHMKMVVEDLQQIIADGSTRSTAKRTMAILCGAALLVAVSVLGLLIGVIYLGASGKSEGGVSERVIAMKGAKDICLTPKCLHAAAWYIDMVDTTVDPCEDFFNYACGKWRKNTYPPPDYKSFTLKDQIHLQNEEKWRNILESGIKRKTVNSYERKIKTFYEMCLHDYGRMKEGGSMLVDMVRSHLSGWYVLDPLHWSDHWNLAEALRRAHTDCHVDVVFETAIWPDMRNTKRNILTIFPGTYELSTADFENENREHVRQKYKAYIKKLGGLLLRDAKLNATLTQNEITARLQQFVEDVYNQEKKLSELRDRSQGWMRKVVPLQEFASNFTQIDWVRIFSSMFREAGVSASTEVSIAKLEYFQGLDELLRQESTNMTRMMNNFIVWQVVKSYAGYLSWEYRYTQYEYIQLRWGVTEFPSTWESCLNLLHRNFGMAMAAFFYNTHVATNAPDVIHKMNDHIKGIYLDRLSKITWMDNVTKPIAIQKIKDMVEFLGYPPEITHDSEIDRIYLPLQVNKSEGFFRAILRSNEFLRYEANQELMSEFTDNLWRYAAWANGGGGHLTYYYFFNTGFVSPGSMIFPIFDPDLPMAVNYGAMGAHFGSGSTIAVGSIGRWVLNGTIHQWWSQNTLNNYKKQVKQCYLDSYSNQTAGPYLVEGQQVTVPINGNRHILTLESRTTGVQVAFQAYREWSIQNGWRALPGLNLTGEQLFFVAQTQARCSLEHPEYSYTRALKGYIPDDIMYNGIVSQTPEFAEVFSCSAKSKLKKKQFCRFV